MSREQTLSIVWSTEAPSSPSVAELDLLESVLSELITDMQTFIDDDED